MINKFAPMNKKPTKYLCENRKIPKLIEWQQGNLYMCICFSLSNWGHWKIRVGLGLRTSAKKWLFHQNLGPHFCFLGLQS